VAVVDLADDDEPTPDQRRLALAMEAEGDPWGDFLAELTRRPAWMEHAACRGKPTGLFFPSRGGKTWPAVSVCCECSVRTECDTYAEEARQVAGVPLGGIWGGRSQADRRAGRPFAG
jgi:hypothetical protein